MFILHGYLHSCNGAEIDLIDKVSFSQTLLVSVIQIFVFVGIKKKAMAYRGTQTLVAICLVHLMTM